MRQGSGRILAGGGESRLHQRCWPGAGTAGQEAYPRCQQEIDAIVWHHNEMPARAVCFVQPGTATVIEDSARLALAPKIAMRQMGETQGAVLVRFSDGQLYSCNDVTAAFLAALDGRRSLAEVTDLLFEDFDVDRGRLAADLAEIAERLVSEGLVRMVPAGKRERAI